MVAETLKELKELVDRLYEQYGIVPVVGGVILNEVPGDFIKGCEDYETVIEVG